jgi:hypothetical protein
MAILKSSTPTASTVLGIVAVALAASFFFWDSPFLLPLKVFTVYIHEACHALAALLTGGTPVALSVRLDESGVTQSLGGFFPLVSAAGYVGTACLGALLIALSRQPQLQKGLVTLLCGLLLYLTLTVLRPWQWEFWAGGMLVCAWGWFNYKKPLWAEYLNLFIGSFFCVYSVHDFQDFFYAVQYTDAGILAASWGLPFLAMPIALVWMGINLTMMYKALDYALKPNKL